MKVPDRSAPSWQTPLYQQYWSLKDQVPGTLLFFRLGDFFELFGEDAVAAAPLLEVQLTSRDRSEVPIPMCGVPYHAWESYAEKILSKGLRVTLTEQVDEPGANGKKLVDRRITRILTPGLPIDPQRIDAKEFHYLCALGAGADPHAVEIYLLDFLGRRIFGGQIVEVAKLAELLQATRPREIIYARDFPIDDERFDFLRRDHARKLFPWAAGDCLQILKDYLAYTQRWTFEQVEDFLPAPESLAQFRGAEYEAHLSPQVVEQWDIVPHLSDLLDNCGSAGGSRELKRLLAHPLARPAHIRARQALVRDLPVPQILELTKEIYDLERLVGRITIRAAKPVELLRVRDSLRILKRFDELAQKEWAQKLSELTALEMLPRWEDAREAITFLEREFSRTLCDAPSAAPDCRDLICAQVDARFDELRGLYKNLETWLNDFEAKLKAETKIANLKVRFNRVSGFYIEVSKSHLAKIPDGFERKQTLVNAERFTHPELKAREEEILGAEDKLERKAKEIIEQLCDQLRAFALPLLKALRIVSFIDALAGADRAIGRASAHGPWVYPEIKDGKFFFEIREGRHPIIEARERAFVPNSVALGVGRKRTLLLTGPNMAGKSTLMRQSGIILLLAQTGLRVSAEQATLAPASGFYSRMGASDRILFGESTFMVEMREMAGILRDADENSFVLIDEIGRGTSTRDGLALAKSFLEYFAVERPAITLFATHYHELAPFSQSFERVLNASMSIREWKGDLVFLRKLIYEPAPSSYGLHVAKLAGISQKILARAKTYYRSAFEAGEATSLPLFEIPPSEKKLEDAFEKFDSELKKWSQKIHEVDLDALSPRDAWKLVEELKNSAAHDIPES